MPVFADPKSYLFGILESKGIDVRPESRIDGHDPIRILELNLMSHPQARSTTDAQLACHFAKAPHPVHITSAVPNGLEQCRHEKRPFFSDVKNDGFDLLWASGAPNEHRAFATTAIPELDSVWDALDWSEDNTLASTVICWTACAALLRTDGVPYHKVPEADKLFGLYPQRLRDGVSSDFGSRLQKTLRRTGEEVGMPVARCCYLIDKEVLATGHHEIIQGSRFAEAGELYTGPGIVYSDKLHRLYLLNHGEYASSTLANEFYHYFKKDEKTTPPANYDLAMSSKCPGPSPWSGTQQAIVDTQIIDVLERRAAARASIAAIRMQRPYASITP